MIIPLLETPPKDRGIARILKIKTISVISS